jgi:hypothetical protein
MLAMVNDGTQPVGRTPASRRRLSVDLAWIVAALVGTVFLFWLAGKVNGAEQRQPCPAMESPHHEALDKLAQQHAEYMARVQVQGHQGFPRRAAEAQRATGLCAVAEVAAETWEWQRDATPAEQWAEYVQCWRQSPGHWSVARVRHKLVGTGSARGQNGVWYGVILAAD